MKQRSEVLAELRAQSIKQLAIAHQTDGLRKLFDAATICQNATLCDTYRQQLHFLLDEALDTTSSITLLTRHLLEHYEP